MTNFEIVECLSISRHLPAVVPLMYLVETVIGAMRDIGMPEHHLRRAQIGGVLQKIGREAVCLRTCGFTFFEMPALAA
jgi:hypothetical protein